MTMPTLRAYSLLLQYGGGAGQLFPHFFASYSLLSNFGTAGTLTDFGSALLSTFVGGAVSLLVGAYLHAVLPASANSHSQSLHPLFCCPAPSVYTGYTGYTTGYTTGGEQEKMWRAWPVWNDYVNTDSNSNSGADLDSDADFISKLRYAMVFNIQVWSKYACFVCSVVNLTCLTLFSPTQLCFACCAQAMLLRGLQWGWWAVWQALAWVQVAMLVIQHALYMHARFQICDFIAFDLT